MLELSCLLLATMPQLVATMPLELAKGLWISMATTATLSALTAQTLLLGQRVICPLISIPHTWTRALRPHSL